MSCWLAEKKLHIGHLELWMGAAVVNQNHHVSALTDVSQSLNMSLVIQALLLLV